MKKLLTILSALMLVLCGSGIAGATFIETTDIYSYSVGGTVGWTHTYDFSEPDPIQWATLTIVADDVDSDEQDSVYINGSLLGTLNTLPGYTNWGYTPGAGGDLTSTIFNLDVALLDFTMPISVSIESSWGSEIETSTLTVQGATAAPVPEPSTILLMGAGLLGLVGYNRKRFSKKS